MSGTWQFELPEFPSERTRALALREQSGPPFVVPLVDPGVGVWPSDPKAHVMAAVGAFALVGGVCAAVWRWL